MRRLVLLIALLAAAPSVAHAEAQRTRILVLPLPETDAVRADAAAAFDARLVVALDESGRITAVTPAEEPECVSADCLADLGVANDVELVLSLSLLREDGALTLFATLVDTATKSASRRTELTGLSATDLTKRAPADVARWAAGSRARAAALGVVLPTTGVSRDAAIKLSDRLTADGGKLTIVPLERKEDRVTLTHRAEVAITSFSIVKKRHHVRRYLDGVLVGTVTVTDLATREVVFQRTVKVTASKRARYSSTIEVTSLLVTDAVEQWMTAFNSEGVALAIQKGKK